MTVTCAAGHQYESDTEMRNGILVMLDFCPVCAEKVSRENEIKQEQKPKPESTQNKGSGWLRIF